MNPYQDARVLAHVRAFLDKYFDDTRHRTLILGINPGRFGAGITGVTFTDPVALADFCGIPNDLGRRRELSSVFVYQVIDRLGGPAEFYRHFFLSAISPLGFTRGGKNLNYYDEPALRRATTPFIVACTKQQIALAGRRDHVIILGAGENLKFFEALNDEHGFFHSIRGLEHPRFIMQYRLKKLGYYLDRYEEALRDTMRSES